MIACEFSDVLPMLSGFIAPATLLIATYIAFQQWRTNCLKVRHDLYDRRYAVFMALSGFLAQTQSDTFSINFNTIIPFGQKVKESYFLFDDEISNYLEDVLQKGMGLCTLNSKLNDPRLDAGKTSETRPQLASELSKQLGWFEQQLHSVARKKFKKHLKLY